MYAARVPRQVRIGDAAAFVGVTPRTIRHYHDIGLLPEPERGSDDRRRYGYDDVVRLLWVRTMADAGIALDDIRDAFTGSARAAADDGADGEDGDVEGVLARLETTLAAQEAELQRQRSAVRRMRTRGSRLGLLSDVVAGRLEELPEGSLRPAALDTLLVTERIFGPLGAAVQATRFVALAGHPGLQEWSDRVDAAEESLDDTADVDDPRVAEVAAERHAFEQALEEHVEVSGLARHEEALLDSWEASHPTTDDDGHGPGGRRRSVSAARAVEMVPYDFSPARVRCLELAGRLAGADTSGRSAGSAGAAERE